MVFETPGYMTAKFAALIDAYHVTPFELAKLTDWQIFHLYFHKRNKDGSIREPDQDLLALPSEAVDTFEGELMQLEMLHVNGLITNYDEAREALARKYGVKPTGNGEDNQQSQ